MMFQSTLVAASLALFAIIPSIVADNATTNNHVGYSAPISTLDGGLGGVVTVTSPTQLTVASYVLQDASAPALYWWGSTTSTLSTGFRISSIRVSAATTSASTLSIVLDSGKTSADFVTVGLWCERFSLNFGQANLVAGAAGASPTTAVVATQTSAAAATTSSKASGAERTGAMAAVAVMVGGFVVLMV